MPVKLTLAAEPSVSSAPMLRTTSGWKISAAADATSTDRKSTTIAGLRRTMSQTVKAGTSRSQGVMWNCAERTSEYRAIWASGTPACVRPRMVKITSVISIEGTVVRYM